MDRPTISEQLRDRARGDWDRAVGHPLFREIAADTVDDAVFRRYLTIEFGFIDTAAAVMGFAVAKAPDLQARRHLAAGLHGLTTDQCAFFEDALGPGAAALRPPSADGLHRHFLAVARAGTYVEIIACMLAAEWMYAAWCRGAHATPSVGVPIAAWVALHADAAFTAQVSWMRRQLDTLAAAAAPDELQRLAEIFGTALAQEVLFHDAAYDLTP